MATIALPEPPTAPVDELPVPAARLYRLTVAEYLKMIDAGILRKPYRLYLWKGLIVTKMTKGRPHTVATTRLYDAFKPLVAGVAYVEQEQPRQSSCVRR